MAKEAKKKRRFILTVPEVEGMFLGQYVPEDAEVIFELIDSCRDHLNANGEGIADKYPTLESVRESIEKNPPEAKKLRMGIWVKDVFVGSVNLKSLGPGVAELGYFIGKQHLGHHYAALASRRLIQAAFKSGKTKTLIAEAAKTNFYSITILEALGFEATGETENHFIYTLERWIPFDVDSTFFWGIIGSRAEWNRVVNEECGGKPDRLLALRKRPPSNPKCMIQFRDSEDPICKEGVTLGQWMKANKLI